LFNQALKYVIQKLDSHLPNDIRNNFLLVYSNAETRYDCLARRSVAEMKLNIPDDNTFYMDNSAFSRDYITASSGDKQHMRKQWNASMSTVGSLAETIAQFSAVNTDSFRDVMRERDRIKTILHGVKLNIKNLQDVQIQLDQAEEQSKHAKANASQFSNFTSKRSVTQTQQVDTPYHNTICGNCNHVCHQNCGLSEITTKGSNQFVGCAAFTGDCCTQCPGKCSYSTHYHARKIITTTTAYVDDILHDVKQKYDAAVKAQQGASVDFSNATSARAGIDAAIRAEVTKLHKSCSEIMARCSGFNLVSELYLTIEQLEKDMAKLRDFKAVADAKQHIDLMKTIAQDLSNMPRAVPPAKKMPPRPASLSEMKSDMHSDQHEDSGRTKSSVLDDSVGAVIRRDVYVELRKIIGMREVKESINRLVLRALVDVDRARINGKSPKFNGFGHFIFKGNPGTGVLLILCSV
jgi:hypothetical protein